MGKLVTFLFPFLIIIFIVSVFFYPVFLHNLVPIPADHAVGIYYPWLDYQWPGFPTGVPVKNPIAADVISFMYPMQTFAVDALKSGKLPLWNPLIFAGTPLLANFQSAPFSPVNILYWILPKFDAWTAQIILQQVLAGIFTFLLLKYFQRSTLSSIIGSLIYPFSGFMMIWLEWNGHGLVAALFPLVFLLALKYLDTGRYLFGLLLSIVIALQLFSGYPQIMLYEFLAIGLGIFIVQKKDLITKRLLALLVFITIGLALAAVQILPGYELIKQSQRDIEIVETEWALLRLRSVITFLAPDYFGNHATYNYWGPADYTQSVGFSGVVTTILGILGALGFLKHKGVSLSLVWIFVCLVTAFDNPFSRILHQSGLLSSQAASAHRILVLSNLSIAILASFGLDAILKNKINKRNILYSVILPMSLLLLYFLASLLVYFYPEFYPDKTATLEKIKLNMTVGLRNLSIPLFLLVLTTVTLLIAKRLKNYKQILVVFLGVLILVELFRFGWKFTPFSPKQIIFPNTPVFDFLQKQQKPFRINANEVVPVNLIMPYGIETVEGYDAVYPIRFAKYISALNSGQTDTTVMGRYGLIFNQNSTLLDLANVKFLLTLKYKQNGVVDPSGQIDSKYNNAKFKKVFEDRSVVVLENSQVLPRVFMVYSWDVEKNEDKALKSLLNKYPLKDKVILEMDPGITPQDGHGEVNLGNYSTEREIVLSTDKPGILFISDSWYPGWVSFIDGARTEIFKADYNFMAVPIKTSGSHTVIIKYEPETYAQGKMITVATAAGLFLVSSCYYLFKLRKKIKYA